MENKKINEITDEELRRQIKGNLAIAADTWPIHQLRSLENRANDLAMAGLFAEGLLYSGIMDIYNLIYDETGQIKLSSNPDDEHNIFKVLGEQIAKNDARKAEKNAEVTETEDKTGKTGPGFKFF